MIRRTRRTTLFPYTTLFRSRQKISERRRFYRYSEIVKLLRQLFIGPSLCVQLPQSGDRKSTRLNSSHRCISYADFCLKKKNVTAPPMSAPIKHQKPTARSDA